MTNKKERTPLAWAEHFRELVRDNEPNIAIIKYLRYCKEKEQELFARLHPKAKNAKR